MIGTRWIKILGRGLLPDACRLCRAPLAWKDAGEKTEQAHSFLCPSCASGISRIKPPFCTLCGLPFQKGPDHVCGPCLRHPPAFDQARAFCLYEGSVMEMIHAFKYAGRQELAAPLAFFMAETWRDHWTAAPDRIFPVPMSTFSLWKRGFNQAGILARAFAAEMGWSGKMAPLIDVKSFVKIKKTASQTGLGRAERKANVRNAFGVKKDLTGEHILLVDDVLTTGATAHACAKALRKAGALSVSVLTVARTP